MRLYWPPKTVVGRTWLGVIVICSFGCGQDGAVASGTATTHVQDDLSGAKGAPDNSHYAQAIRTYTEMLARTDLTWKRRAYILKDRADALERVGMVTEAIRDYSEAARLYPGNGAAYFNRGQIYAEQSDYIRACADFERTATLNPTYPYAWYDLGYCLGQMGREEDAISAFSTAEGLKPAWLDPVVARAVAETVLGRFEAAETDLTKAASMEPEDKNVIKALAILRIYEGRFAKAAELLVAWMNNKPAEWEPYYLLGQVHFLQGDITGAKSYLEQANAKHGVAGEEALLLRVVNIQLGLPPLHEVVPKKTDTAGTELICQFLDGQIDAATVLTRISDLPKYEVPEQECRAFFYVGYRAYLAKDFPVAADFLKRAATQKKNFWLTQVLARKIVGQLGAAESPEETHTGLGDRVAGGIPAL